MHCIPELYSAGDSFFPFALSTSSFHVRPMENRSKSCACSVRVHINIIVPMRIIMSECRSTPHFDDGRSDETSIDSDCHGDVNILVVLDAALHVGSIDDGVLL